MNILKPPSYTLSLKPVKDCYHSLLPEFLHELAQIFAVEVFIETGTFRGDTADAARHIFRTVHTIELSPALYRAARDKFSGVTNCHVHHGDSATVLHKILPPTEGTVLLWLDAHYSQGDTAKGKVNTPVLAELQALKQSGKHEAVILIDDVRHFQPAGVDTSQTPTLQGYPTLRQIQHQIHEINREYQFVLLGDLALAYPPGYAVGVSPLLQACTVSRLFDDGGTSINDVLAGEEIIGAVQDPERSTIEILAKSILGAGSDPVGGHYRLWYGLALAKQQKYGEACQEFMQAFERGCRHWRVFWYLAQAASHLGQNDISEKAIRLVMEAVPDFQPAQLFFRQLSIKANGFGDSAKATGHCLGVVFSKDRALQLEALLQSFFLHCQDADQISLTVLYTTSSEFHEQQYAHLISEFETVQFQKERDFQTDLRALLGQSRYILFLVDDNLFVGDFYIAEIIETLCQHPEALGLSLRLGKNTRSCYMADAEQQLPDFRAVGSKFLEYDWTVAEHDFGYPLEVSSSVYRTQDLLPLLNLIQFSNPNTLELKLAANKTVYKDLRRRLLCFSQSVAFSAPVNVVQTAWRNKAGNHASYSSDSLARMYAAGYRLDVARYSGFVPNGVHQEIPLEFRPLNTNVNEPETASRVPTAPVVSVVIITYQRSRWLGQAIQSALNQTHPVDEVLVIDDGSPTEAAAQVVHSFSDRRLRYFKKEKNEGRPQARNTGIEQATGDFILWLDDDDLLLPDTLQHYLALLQKEPTLDIIYGKVRYFETQTEQLGDIYDPIDWSGKTADLLNTLTVGSPIPNPGAFVRKSLYQRIGGYAPHFQRAEDYEFWTRAASSATMKKLDDFVCQYRIHADNVSFGDLVDLSYESKVIRNLLGRYDLRELFSKLDWRQPQQAETKARLQIARSFLKYDDYYNATKTLESIAVEQLTPEIIELLLKTYLCMGDTEQINDRLPVWAAAGKIDQQVLTRYAANLHQYRALLTRANECLTQRNFSEAQATLRQGHQQYGHTSDLLMLMAQGAWQQGDWLNCFNRLKKAVHCAPADHRLVQLALAMTRSEPQKQEILAIQKRLLES